MRNKIIFALLASLFFAGCNMQETKQKQATEETVISEAVAKPNTLSQAELEDGWILMFNGLTPDMWRSHNGENFPKNGWEVVDGTLHVIGSGRGEAGGGGDVLYNKKFSNFELSLEWKVSEGGNSGIFYLAQEIPGDPVWKSAPEMQILDNAKHPDAKLGVDGNRAAGALYDLIPGKFEAVKPAEEWNQARLMVYKGTVVHTMNGENVLEYHLWTDDWKAMVGNSKFKDYEHFMNPAPEGYIVLQDHGDDVWFRNIKIREL
ncbi:MAG: DUF1080 domain-containing protein [Bacteroidetes bacterium]|nr:MAG: DUF1080 domain-containing protein [Bacteroidota bacterium]